MNKMGQPQTVEAICLDSGGDLLLLLPMQQLMIVQVTAFAPGWIQRKQQFFVTHSVPFSNKNVPNVPPTDNFSNFSLIYLTSENMPNKFLWYCLITSKGLSLL